MSGIFSYDEYKEPNITLSSTNIVHEYMQTHTHIWIYLTYIYIPYVFVYPLNLIFKKSILKMKFSPEEHTVLQITEE